MAWKPVCGVRVYQGQSLDVADVIIVNKHNLVAPGPHTYNDFSKTWITLVEPDKDSFTWLYLRIILLMNSQK